MRPSTDLRARWEDIFRGYDIRGRYPQEMGPPTARRLGRALAQAFDGPFLLGRDARRESERFARELTGGLLSRGSEVVHLGIVPTPEVAFLARRRTSFALAVTPSHNAVGYVGLKGFTPSGRLFDREWQHVRDAFRRTSAVADGGAPHRGSPRSRTVPRSAADRTASEEYLVHVTRGLESELSVVLDCRGGATARVAPLALRRLGNRVVELKRGFSPRFFGQSPEPRADTLGPLATRIAAIGADLGFAFDGDGDRCVAMDERGHRVEPEVIALLLHRAFADPESAIVASVDSSRRLDSMTRTIRSRVGGRFVTRAMRRTGAEVAVEPSGHYYVRRYGPDSDGILVACLVSHALAVQRTRLSALARQFGPVHRGASTLDFGTITEARRAFRCIVRSLGKHARVGLDGVTVDSSDGWCLIRRSNTQPSIRIAYEASGAAALRRLERSVVRLGDSVRLTDPR